MTIEQIKQRFGIIGNSSLLNRAIDIAIQVASTDISVLITGESGVGKEFFPRIIHSLSHRKHGEFIAINCGAIPEGTIDSELFGHEKGAFTDAREMRKGYFEVANNGTIFLDEVGELPLQTQVRLLRVLETGEFMRVGSSKPIKTNVRVVAATNVNILDAIDQGKFREDLYYRLNTVPIYVPSLKDRKEDIYILFRKFASEIAEKYKMPSIRLDEDSKARLTNYSWPGNVRQLKNFAEQISIIEEIREVNIEILNNYLPKDEANNLPVLFKDKEKESGVSEREILYKVLFDMQKDVNELKKLVFNLISNPDEVGAQSHNLSVENSQLIKKLYQEVEPIISGNTPTEAVPIPKKENVENYYAPEPIQEPEEYKEPSLSIVDTEIELIKKALAKHNNKRRAAAVDLGISERTLYRKIKEYNIS